jgi:hypothetical protein
VRFGVFYELQLPKPWSRDDEDELLNHALDQIELGVGEGSSVTELDEIDTAPFNMVSPQSTTWKPGAPMPVAGT